MEFTYKKAGTDDLDALVETRCEVLKNVFELPDGTDMEELKKESEKYYSENLENGLHVAYTAYEGDNFAGCGGICFVRIMPSVNGGQGIEGHIMNMYTRPAYRSRGIASKIVELLVEEGRRWGVKRISLETTPAARTIYTRLGFEEAQDVMERLL